MPWYLQISKLQDTIRQKTFAQKLENMPMVYLTIAIKKVRQQLFKSCHIYHLLAKSISNFQVQGTLPASVEGLITQVLIISTLFRAVCPKELDKLKLVSLTNK
jgi:hypothetical protein